MLFCQECLNTDLAGVPQYCFGRSAPAQRGKRKNLSNIREGNLYAAEDAVGGAEGALRHKSV